MKGASVEMLGVSVKNCPLTALFAENGESVTATQHLRLARTYGSGLGFMDGGSKGFFTNYSKYYSPQCGEDGVNADGKATLVELVATKIHRNKY